MRVHPPVGAGHPHSGRIFRKVRGVGRVLKEFTVAQTGAVHPGDGKVQVPLTGEVTEEEGGRQKRRVWFAVVRVRDKSVKQVAHEIQRNCEAGEPAEKHHDSVIAPVAARVRENLSFILHLKTTARGHRRSSDFYAVSAHSRTTLRRGGRGRDLKIQPRGSTFMTHLLPRDRAISFRVLPHSWSPGELSVNDITLMTCD